MDYTYLVTFMEFILEPTNRIAVSGFFRLP